MFAFIEEHLDQAALDEYRRMVESCIEPIPEEASPEVKYEIAFRSWMRECSAIYRFVRERMGDEGIEQMALASVEALKREDSRLSLYLLGMIRVLSPGLAFRMVAKQSAYEFQWLTPYSVDELSRQRGVFSIPRCKILDYPDSEDTCRVACQERVPSVAGRAIQGEDGAGSRGEQLYCYAHPPVAVDDRPRDQQRHEDKPGRDPVDRALQAP